MKNKKFTYFLGLIVVVVWGVIIYRVIKSTAGNDEIYQPRMAKLQKEPYNDYAVPVDTTHLLLNYRDPFALKKQVDTVKQIGPQSTSGRVIPAISKPVFNWSFIKYSGFIKNPSSKKLVAVVHINGKAVMMSEGETAEQVKLIRNLQDSIKISYNGKTAFIKMRSDAL